MKRIVHDIVCVKRKVEDSNSKLNMVSETQIFSNKHMPVHSYHCKY